MNPIEVITAVAAVAAVLVAALTSALSLKEQRRLAEASIEQQLHVAHQQFLWDGRYALYSRVLTCLRARGAEVAHLSESIREHQRAADQADTQRAFADVTEALDEIRREHGLAPSATRLDTVEAVAHLDATEILAVFSKILMIPPDLEESMRLLGSEAAARALATYTGSVALPDLMRDDCDADAWVAALELKLSAADRLAEELRSELMPPRPTRG